VPNGPSERCTEESARITIDKDPRSICVDKRGPSKQWHWFSLDHSTNMVAHQGAQLDSEELTPTLRVYRSSHGANATGAHQPEPACSDQTK
jgi:hypothetical protein